MRDLAARLAEWLDAHEPQRRWRLFAVGLLVCAAAVVVNGLRLRESQGRLAVATTELAAARSGPPVAAPQARADFVAGLPAEVTPLAVIQTVQRASREAGATLSSLQVREQAATATQLGRLDLSLSLRGSYAALKQFLAEVVGRYPSATLRSLQWRAGESAAAAAAPVATEAQVVLSIWTAPQGLGRPASRGRD